jgi:S-formylglutathione hydrolase FrmB
MRPLVRIGALAAAAIASLVIVSGAGSRSSSADADIDTAFRSHALGRLLHYEVYLPADYKTSGRRYPVIYALHGLPASAQSYRGMAFVANALHSAGGEAIVVAPQGAAPGDSDPEYHDWGIGRDWETALTKELPAVVDARFRTIRRRAGRALIGFSAGGYGAMILGVHHLDEFSVLESWSGYFHPTDPTGHHALDVGSADANAYASVHTFVPKLRTLLKSRPTYLAFYVGDRDFFFAENVRLNRELDQAGVRHVFRVYPGGHQQSLWAAHASPWLSAALAHLPG